MCQDNKSLSIVHVQCQTCSLQFPLKHDAFLISRGMFTFFCEAQGKVSQQSGLGRILTFLPESVEPKEHSHSSDEQIICHNLIRFLASEKLWAKGGFS